MPANTREISPFPPAILRGVEQLVREEELKERWEEARAKATPLRVKIGFDPTAPDLHLGHYVILKKLREFQEYGHRVVLIIGDFTAAIGDPTGRNEARPPLSREAIEANARTYRDQVFRVLLPQQTEVLYNSQWLEKLTPRELIRMASTTTVSRMLEREDFSLRFQERKPIHLHEFLYPLLQGYDSVAVHADVELGGRDQIFNLLVGRELQKLYGQREQIVMTMPLLLGLDGHQKMSKSTGNYVGITEPPEEQFGKIMSIPDSLLREYYLLLTDEPVGELEEEIRSGRLHPMEAKKRLAYTVVEKFHGEEAARRAGEHFSRVFQERAFPEEVPEFRWDLRKGPLWLPRAFKESGVVPSTKEALRLFSEGAVRLNSTPLPEPGELREPGEYLFKIGKRRFLRIVVE